MRPDPAPAGAPRLKICVTGAAGFLGSHLCDRLLADGHEVIGIDNLLTGNSRNIAHLAGEKRFRFVRHDVTHFISVDGPLDAVLHFASPASPIDYLELPIQTLKVGSLGTHNALGLAMAKNARFLLASTSEVYGDPLVHPQPETYWGNVNPIGPRGVYDEAKRFAEAMTMAYHRAHGVDTRIVRIFNTYGERMRPRDGRVVPALIGQALAGEPMTVFGDGSQTRSFCYVSDLIDGIYRLLHSSETVAGEHRQPGGAVGARVRADDPEIDRRPERDRVPAASRGRSARAPAGHFSGAGDARVEAEGASRGGPDADDRLLPLGRRGTALGLTVAADRLDRAAVHRLLALRPLLGVRGLREDVGVGILGVPLKVGRSRDAAHVAVDALRVDVESCPERSPEPCRARSPRERKLSGFRRALGPA